MVFAMNLNFKIELHRVRQIPENADMMRIRIDTDYGICDEP